MGDDLSALPSPTPLQRRLIDAAVEIDECRPDNPEYLHSVLCQVGLPRSRTKERFFERSNGTTSIAIEAGRIYRRGQWVEKPLPYGALPRLALIHISSEAVRTKSPHIEIGDSIREFLLKLGMQTNGYSYGEMKRQMENLAACSMMLGMSTPSKEITIATKPIEHFEAWFHYDGRQRSMWPGYLELSNRFFETMVENAVPLDPRALFALKKSSLALDVYTWLAHRLRRVRQSNGIKLSWRNLKIQFGQEYKTSKDFKKEFRIALRKVYAVYPDAKIDEVSGGIILYSSPPPIPETKNIISIK